MTRLLVVLGGIIASAVAAVAVWARKKDELDAEFEASAPERGLTPLPDPSPLPEQPDRTAAAPSRPPSADADAGADADADAAGPSSNGTNGAAGTPMPAAAGPEAGDEAPAADDLRRIKGIGSVSHERLTAEGVTTFAQIAAWDDEAVASLAERIHVSAERIRREDWVGQARTILGVDDERTRSDD